MNIESIEASYDDYYTFGAEPVLIDPTTTELRANTRSRRKEEKMQKRRETRRRLDALLETKRLRDELGYLGDWPKEETALF